MILTSHQPDLLPYTGFWHKLWRADLMDLAIWDQFQSRGYQRRVTMRDKWASLPIQKCPIETPIAEVRLADGAVNQLMLQIQGRYQGSRYWDERSNMVFDWIAKAAPADSRSEPLWAFNLSLILSVRDWLGIRTPIAIGQPLHATGVDGVVEMCEQYAGLDFPFVYLSGQGGRGYLGDDPERAFGLAGVRLLWSRHEPDSGDSILTAIFDHKDVLSIVKHEADR
jgi:hypothetical protein